MKLILDQIENAKIITLMFKKKIKIKILLSNGRKCISPSKNKKYNNNNIKVKIKNLSLQIKDKVTMMHSILKKKLNQLELIIMIFLSLLLCGATQLEYHQQRMIFINLQKRINQLRTNKINKSGLRLQKIMELIIGKQTKITIAINNRINILADKLLEKMQSLEHTPLLHQAMVDSCLTID